MMIDPADAANREEAEPDRGEALRADAAGDPTPGREGVDLEASPTDTARAALEAEVAALKDRMLRTLAEMENLRRRTEREVQDAKAYGISSFAREMVQTADNLQRGLASLPPGARDASDAVRSFVEGVELTERDLLSRLARFGVKPIETTGMRFDPNRHEALFEMPDPSVPSGTVVQQVETGYVIGERVLRPAKVGVSRGGPKAETPAAN